MVISVFQLSALHLLSPLIAIVLAFGVASSTEFCSHVVFLGSHTVSFNYVALLSNVALQLFLFKQLSSSIRWLSALRKSLITFGATQAAFFFLCFEIGNGVNSLEASIYFMKLIFELNGLLNFALSVSLRPYISYASVHSPIDFSKQLSSTALTVTRTILFLHSYPISSFYFT